jgi:D-alanyl-D-alanine carboxypeptidase
MVRQTRPFRPFPYSLRPRALLRRGIICALFAGLAILGSGLSGPASARQAYIVMDAATGDVLSSANADRYHPPASLTKMMVLYMAFEALKDGRITLKKKLLVSRRAARQRPSRLGLGARTRISAKDAIMAMITKSANDAAVVMAEALAGSERKFARKMTIRAREMGMTRTTFRNATGLYSRGQVSSARDMAVLARALVTDFPKQYALFATRKFNYRGRTYRNHNRLLGRYPGVDGIKTGYIRASGFNVAVSAKRDGRRVIAVYLGGRSAKKRDRRVTALLLRRREEPRRRQSDRRQGGPGRRPGRHQDGGGRDPCQELRLGHPGRRLLPTHHRQAGDQAGGQAAARLVRRRPDHHPAGRGQARHGLPGPAVRPDPVAGRPGLPDSAQEAAALHHRLARRFRPGAGQVTLRSVFRYSRIPDCDELGSLQSGKRALRRAQERARADAREPRPRPSTGSGAAARRLRDHTTGHSCARLYE